MKYVVAIVVALVAATPARAGFLDDLFGGWTASAKHINNHSTGHHVASWYNDRSGRTASGMRVHYGVAHKTLPFGTRVLITNPRNGRSVTAVVTDRGPFVRGRTLDVNQNVARALGFSGVSHLHMEIVR
jgi:rare lipoprotein A